MRGRMDGARTPPGGVRPGQLRPDLPLPGQRRRCLAGGRPELVLAHRSLRSTEEREPAPASPPWPGAAIILPPPDESARVRAEARRCGSGRLPAYETPTTAVRIGEGHIRYWRYPFMRASGGRAWRRRPVHAAPQEPENWLPPSSATARHRRGDEISPRRRGCRPLLMGLRLAEESISRDGYTLDSTVFARLSGRAALPRRATASAPRRGMLPIDAILTEIVSEPTRRGERMVPVAVTSRTSSARFPAVAPRGRPSTP